MNDNEPKSLHSPWLEFITFFNVTEFASLVWLGTFLVLETEKATQWLGQADGNKYNVQS
jgi:hypothetical protein